MKKILIAYFSLQNHTLKIAEKIKEICRGDLFEISTEVEYPLDFNYLALVAQKQLENKTFPKLRKVLSKDKMKEYDTILLGFPIWWEDLPRAVCTFLKMYDFSNKIIIPFFTHLGSSFGGKSMQTMKDMAPSGKFAEEFVFSVHDDDIEKVDYKIGQWLKSISEKY